MPKNDGDGDRKRKGVPFLLFSAVGVAFLYLLARGRPSPGGQQPGGTQPGVEVTGIEYSVV